MRRDRGENKMPSDPLLEKLRQLDPFTMEAVQGALQEDGIPFLFRELVPNEEEVKEAVLALGRKKRRLRTPISLLLLCIVAFIYVIDFVRDPSYVLALVLALLALGLAVFLVLSPKREAAGTAKLYCEQVPKATLCLFQKGLCFTDGAGRTDLAGRGELLWAETPGLFACLVRGRGLVYYRKNGLNEEEAGFLRAAIEE